MNRIIKHKINIPIYYGYLIVICADDVEEIAKKYDVPGIKNKCHDAYVFRNKTNEYVYVQKASITYGAVAHEAKHLVNYIFSDRGIKLDVENDEAECYLLGWIVNKIHKYINIG
jgi:hypothetical protein